MLTVILADAELELVPEEIAGHPSVRSHARAQDRKPGEMLLDQNIHASAAKQLGEGERRGRPDILHYTLLTLLESPLAKSGNLQVAIHTRHAELIRVRSDTRLPRGEGRFQGLLGKVLREGASNQPDPLVWSEGTVPARNVLDRLAKGPVVRLDEGGSPASPDDVAMTAKAGDLTVILGAFPSGAFSEAWRKAAPKAAAVWPAALNAWAIAAEVVAAHRRVWGPRFPNTA